MIHVSCTPFAPPGGAFLVVVSDLRIKDCIACSYAKCDTFALLATICLTGCCYRSLAFIGCYSLNLSIHAHALENLIGLRNAGDAPMLLGGEAGGGAGEADDLQQIFFRQLVRLLSGLQEAAHGAAAEDVSRAGGVHHADAGRAVDRRRDIPGRRVAALRAEGHVNQGHTVLLKQLLCALLRGNAPQEGYLLVTDLNDICLAQAPLDSGLRVFLLLSQRLAKVGVQTDQQIVFPRQLNCPAGGGGGRLIRQRECAEMEHPR